MRINGRHHTRVGLAEAQCEGKLSDPFTFGGTVEAPLFEQWFKNKLLKLLPKGHVIIMDNAAFHKKELLHKIAKEHSQTLISLLPYSLEHNPIEHAWGVLKRNVVSKVHQYGSLSETLDAIL